MSDLTERLRATANNGPGKGWPSVEREAREAADRIKELETGLEDMRKVLVLSGGRIAELEADVEHLEDVDSIRCRRLAARVKELEAEKKELLDVLFSSNSAVWRKEFIKRAGPEDIRMKYVSYSEAELLRVRPGVSPKLWRKADK